MTAAPNDMIEIVGLLDITQAAYPPERAPDRLDTIKTSHGSERNKL